MWTVDQIPAGRLIGPLVVLDVSASAKNNPDYEISVQDIARWEQTNGQIPLGAVVMARTGWGSRWNSVEKLSQRRRQRPHALSWILRTPPASWPKDVMLSAWESILPISIVARPENLPSLNIRGARALSSDQRGQPRPHACENGRTFWRPRIWTMKRGRC